MNILQMEDLVKGLPDQVLMQEAQMPSGQIPQFLALSEVQRRKEMRDKFQAPPQATVADQILQGGIASAMPQQPPQGGMAPPQGPPMGAPPGPVMAYGGGMMPYAMADGGAVPSGLQELNDAMVSARYRRGQGFLESVAPNPMNSFQAAKDLPSRLQALQRMADTGPSPYEPGNYGYTQSESGFGNDPFRMGPSGFIQAGHQAEALDRAGAMALGNRYQDYLNRMTNPFAGTGSGIVRDERLGDQSLNLDDYGMGMYGGGQVPYRMQEGRTVPNESAAQRRIRLQAELNRAIQEGAPRSVIEDLRRELDVGFSLRSPGEMSAGAMNQRIGQMGLNPTMEAPAINLQAPDFSAQLNAAMQAPPVAADVAAPGVTPDMAPPADVGAAQQPMDMASLFNQISSGMSVGGGRPTNIAQGAKPFEQYFQFDPNAPALQATDLSPLIQQQEKRGAERAASYAETIKNIENEMKRERLGAVLTTLGANLMAGEGAAGLEKAGALAQQMGKEARQEIAAERRAARTAEEATADRIFALNAQQLTADKEAQRAIFNAQQSVKEKAFAAFSGQMKDQQQAAQAASQLAATLTVGAVNSMRDKIVTEGANARAVLDFAKEQARSLKDTLGTSTVGMAAADIQKLVEETLISGIITGYKAIGQAPPKGFESQIRTAAATTGGTKGTASESDPLGLRR